jgi:hypothetical protein
VTACILMDTWFEVASFCSCLPSLFGPWHIPKWDTVSLWWCNTMHNKLDVKMHWWCTQGG